MHTFINTASLVWMISFCTGLSCSYNTPGHTDSVHHCWCSVQCTLFCCWTASWDVSSLQLVICAFYCRSGLDVKKCLGNERLPRRYGNISLAKLLFSRSGFCVNIKPFIYNESISATISNSYFNEICQEYVFFPCINIERSKTLQELADRCISNNDKYKYNRNLGRFFV